MDNLRTVAKSNYDAKIALLKERENIMESIDILNGYMGDSDTTENEKDLFNVLYGLRLDLLTKYVNTIDLQLKIAQDPKTDIEQVDESLVMYKEAV